MKQVPASQNNQPVIGLFREHRDIETFVFKAAHYKQAYHELIDRINELGGYVAILMGQSTYKGNGVFTKHWVQVYDGSEYRFEKRGRIKVDMLYVKDFFDAHEDDHLLQVNTLAFRQLCSDKHAAYQLLEDFHPKSRLVHTVAESKEAFDDIPGTHIVVKTLYGNSGTGVYVGPKNEFSVTEYGKDFPWQVQQYVETERGIPGIAAGRHDFRVVLKNGEPVIATLRTPPDGEYKSNIGYGGETCLIDRSNIPEALVQLSCQIDVRLSSLGSERFYSADFGLTENGWVLFEVNALPGTLDRARGEEAIYYQETLAAFLVDIAKRERRKQ